MECGRQRDHTYWTVHQPPSSLKEREKVPKGVRAIVINVYFGALLDFDT